MSSRFSSIEAVINDPVFPAVDLALRRGRHIDRDDGDWYAFIADAQDHHEPFYRRFGCELVAQSDGYFYLLPTGDQLARRHLSAGEMLVGQTLALLYLDPATVETGGAIPRERLLDRLGGLIGDRELARALEPRRRKFDDERVVHEIIRRHIAGALRRLARLGFIELLEDDRLRLRAPLLRFADPVRGAQDIDAALARLIAAGQVVDADGTGAQGGKAADTAMAGAAGADDADDGGLDDDDDDGVADDDASRESAP